MVTPRSMREWIHKHFWGLLTLIGLLVVCTWAVRYFKKPGQMTVVESQAMDMTTMKPPVGSVPVAVEMAAAHPFSSKVRYTGTVVPYNEQNIYPRVSGWLTGLKVYNGDTVKPGQLLAVLDSPDLRSQRAEASYGHAASVGEVSVARANLSRMRAERSAARRDIQAAEQDVKWASANVSAADGAVNRAQKELKIARASSAFWDKELPRQESLVKAGYISQRDYESKLAEATASQAGVEAGEAKVEEAKSNAEATRAALASKRIAVGIAGDRASAADAALRSAADEVGQKSSAAKMAGAAKATAAAFDQYRQIRAPFGGVVTRRELSPGVLVNPGTPILNIAQIDKVRLQASVAEQDVSRILVGARVVARIDKGAGLSIAARVTSVSPSTDPVSRTSIVEAVVDNKSRTLYPGDFVSMEIYTSADTDAITVPATAVVTRDGRNAVWLTDCTEKSAKTIYFCTMHPEVTSDKPGICPKCKMDLVPKAASAGKTARLVHVTVGRNDGDRTEILSGVSAGDEVIYGGHRYLREGDAITPTEWSDDGPSVLPAAASAGSMGGQEQHTQHSQKASAGSSRSTAEKDKYVCPMHPEFVSTDPNATCPKCHMRLEKMILDEHKAQKGGAR